MSLSSCSHPSLSPSHILTPTALSLSLSLSLTWPRADLVVIEVDVISAGNRRVLSLLSALAALLLLHLPLLWGHNSTGSSPGPHWLQAEQQTHFYYYHHLMLASPGIQQVLTVPVNMVTISSFIPEL